MLRMRCPDGLQLTRRFAISQPVSVVYDFVDISRHDKAKAAPDADVKLVELANSEYVLVSTMPKLTLSARYVTFHTCIHLCVCVCVCVFVCVCVCVCMYY